MHRVVAKHKQAPVTISPQLSSGAALSLTFARALQGRRSRDAARATVVWRRRPSHRAHHAAFATCPYMGRSRSLGALARTRSGSSAARQGHTARTWLLPTHGRRNQLGRKVHAAAGYVHTRQIGVRSRVAPSSTGRWIGAPGASLRLPRIEPLSAECSAIEGSHVCGSLAADSTQTPTARGGEAKRGGERAWLVA
jgi:hypothetical protein